LVKLSDRFFSKISVCFVVLFGKTKAIFLIVCSIEAGGGDFIRTQFECNGTKVKPLFYSVLILQESHRIGPPHSPSSKNRVVHGTGPFPRNQNFVKEHLVYE